MAGMRTKRTCYPDWSMPASDPPRESDSPAVQDSLLNHEVFGKKKMAPLDFSNDAICSEFQTLAQNR